MRFEIPAAKTLTFEMTIPIRWGDMDAMGHVNNTLYFRYLEVIGAHEPLAAGVGPGPRRPEPRPGGTSPPPLRGNSGASPRIHHASTSAAPSAKGQRR